MHAILKQVALIVVLRMAAATSCKNATLCPCGRTGKNITVCNPDVEDPCRRWAACERCVDGVDGCAECSEGIEGVSCTKAGGHCDLDVKTAGSFNCTIRITGTDCDVICLNRYAGRFHCFPGRGWDPPLPECVQPKDGHNTEIRRKRQLVFPNTLNSYHQSYWQENLQNHRQSLPTFHTYFCPELKSPKLGSISCSTNDRQSICTANCFPGHTFQNMGSTDEVQLSCEGGVWMPYTQFPPCISGGHCDLDVKTAGSFNCTIRITGTDCDVFCLNRYAGRFHCFPGRGWDTPLPGCVQPKVVEEAGCRCENGGRCDSGGSCVCPSGLTGTYCETKVPRVTCPDPGQVDDAYRLNAEGIPLTIVQRYRVGQSVVYTCHEGFALQGKSLIICSAQGSWSHDRPKCIHISSATTTAAAEAPQEVTCPDPGHVSDADRLNSDGTPSPAVQRYGVGQSVVYTCHEGFALQGKNLIICSAQGSWSHDKPRCSRIPFRTTPPATEAPRITCPDPGQVPDADRLNCEGIPLPAVQRYRVGQSVVYTCHEGFALQGNSIIICSAQGSWSRDKPRCARIPSPTVTPARDDVPEYCINPGSISNGQVRVNPDLDESKQPSDELEDSDYPEGTVLQYSCSQGYVLKGSDKLTCEESGLWSDDSPSCTPVTSGISFCRDPGNISNGNRSPASAPLRRGFPEGSQLEYSCSPRYELSVNDNLVCLSGGRWSSDPPKCEPQSRKPLSDVPEYCINPGSISNGQVRVIPDLDERKRPSEDLEDSDYPEGTVLQYSCNEGYVLKGSDKLTCEESGLWSDDSPSCTPASSIDVMHCDNPGQIPNGRVMHYPPLASRSSRSRLLADDDIEFPQGTRLEYTCEDDYMLQGSSMLTCESTGFWSASPPTCTGECGRSFAQTTRRIINGTKTRPGEWPWVVAISVEQDDTVRLICSGAVLNSRTVLTAAHCLSDAANVTLQFGKIHRQNKDDDAKVMVRHSTRFTLHPSYNSTTFDSDIGLVTLNSGIQFTDRVQPICLPTPETTAKNLTPGKKGYVTGWGKTEKHLQPDELLLAELPVHSNDACKESYRRQNLNISITQNMFCAGFENGYQSTCYGDSGSPLVFYDRVTKKHTVEGLVGFGVRGQCGLPGRYTVFTNVFRFMPWILQEIS